MRALRRLGGMVPQGDLKRGRLGKILQRPSDWRICSRHLEGEAVSGGVEKGSMVKEDFVCRAVGYFPIPSFSRKRDGGFTFEVQQVTAENIFWVFVVKSIPWCRFIGT